MAFPTSDPSRSTTTTTTTTTTSVATAAAASTKATAASSKATITMKRKIVERDVSPPPTKRKIVSQTTSSTVANFFRPLSAKEPERTTWRVVDKSLLIAKYVPAKASKSTGKAEMEPRRVAAFDLDSTLIKTSSGKTFASSESDWQWWDSSVPTKLKELHSQGYTMIIFTNQGGIKLDAKPATRLNTFKLKLAAVLTALDIPITLYGATGNDKYRKPRTGMWVEFAEDHDLDVHGVEKGNSFLVGDAAGREGDHSASDRHFAQNIGIEFFTPEGFFLGHEPKQMRNPFDPAAIMASSLPESPRSSPFKKIENLELVILVGSPGAGKSSFTRRYLEPLGYERVNQDLLKSKDRCIKAATEFLKDRRSVVVDNTNADVETRALWVTLAKANSIPVRCIYFTAHPELCLHNDAVRAYGGPTVNPEKRNALPKIAFAGYKSRFKEPQLSEGFLDITVIDFKWEGDEAEKVIWCKHWT